MSPTLQADPEYRYAPARRGDPIRTDARCADAREATTSSACIILYEPEVQPFTDKQIELVDDVRRSGRHRHRERPPPHRAPGADAGADAVGRGAAGAERRQPDGQLHPRSPDRPDHDRQPRGAALGSRRRGDLRVRPGHSGVPGPGEPPVGGGAGRGAARRADPARRRGDGPGGAPPGAGPAARHRRRACLQRDPDPDGAPRPRLPLGAGRAAPVGAADPGRPHGMAAGRGGVPGGGREPSPDLRRPVGPRHAERPALPGARGEEPGARGREPPQVGVPRQHVPRAPDAAERHHRVQRDAPGGSPGPARRRLRPRPPADPRGRQAPPRAHQRRPRPLEDRGRQDGALPRVLRRRIARAGRRGGARAPRAEEREPPRGPVRSRRRRDAGGPDQAPPGALQPPLERLQVHRAGRRDGGRHAATGDRRGRRLDRLRGPGHRDRDDARADGAALRGVRPGRRVDHAPLRRDRPRPRPLPPALPDDGRRHLGGERAGPREHVHDPAAGGGARAGA